MANGWSVRKHRTAIVLVLLLAGQLLGSTVDIESASATTCGSETNAQVGYDGYSRPPASWAETPEGVSGYVMVRNGPVCSNRSYPYTFSTAWVMLQDAGISNHYSQAGYMYDNTAPCMRLYNEYNVGNGFVRHLGACATQGMNVTADVYYTGSTGPYPPPGGGLEMEASQPVPIALSNYMPYDPWALGWGFQPTFFGEVDHSGPNDVPGSAYYPADISALGIQRVTDGNYHPIPCYLSRYSYNLPSPNRYYTDALGCDHIRTWTDPF